MNAAEWSALRGLDAVATGCCARRPTRPRADQRVPPRRGRLIAAASRVARGWRPGRPTARRARSSSRTSSSVARARGRPVSARPTNLMQPEVAGRELVVAALAVERERSRPSTLRCPGSPAAVARRARARGRAGRRGRAATSRAALRRAMARPAARSRLSSSAGAVPARRSGRWAGRAGRCAGSGARGGRRSAAGSTNARVVSMSCSVIAQASASNGSGRRRARSHGARRTTGADERVGAEALVERPQVVVDAEREAHPRDRLLGVSAVSAHAPSTTASAAGWAARTIDGLAVDVQEALEHAAAPAQDAVGPAAGEAKDPWRADVPADLDHCCVRTLRGRWDGCRGRCRSLRVCRAPLATGSCQGGEGGGNPLRRPPLDR